MKKFMAIWRGMLSGSAASLQCKKSTNGNKKHECLKNQLQTGWMLVFQHSERK